MSVVKASSTLLSIVVGDVNPFQLKVIFLGTTWVIGFSSVLKPVKLTINVKQREQGGENNEEQRKT